MVSPKAPDLVPYAHAQSATTTLVSLPMPIRSAHGYPLCFICLAEAAQTSSLETTFSPHSKKRFSEFLKIIVMRRLIERRCGYRRDQWLALSVRAPSARVARRDPGHVDRAGQKKRAGVSPHARTPCLAETDTRIARLRAVPTPFKGPGVLSRSASAPADPTTRSCGRRPSPRRVPAEPERSRPSGQPP